MKQASMFEIIAARCWNVLNEGKTFTPVFTVAVFVIATLVSAPFWDIKRFLWAILIALPFFLIYFRYEFPLRLRWFLWIPVGVWAIFTLTKSESISWEYLLWAFGLYTFFTVFFWGTLYYHLRIGTTWWNFTRIWKLFLKNTDSTSGNVGEQLPKVFLLLMVMASAYKPDWKYDWLPPTLHPAGASPFYFLMEAWLFAAVLLIGSALVDRYLFNWKPIEYPTYTSERPSLPSADTGKPLAKRAVVIVIDGCRKERFEEAETPFLDKLIQEGTYYDQMETTYPARTVCCFSSMFTGTYPREHGIQSNMVWKLGVQCESIFDVMKLHGRKGVLFGCAHLIDAFGDHVESFTAVEHNDVVDHKIMAQAKEIMKRENPDLMVIQMIAVDQTGHSRGALYPEYLDKIKESDELIADFYSWMGQQGFLDDTVLIVMADHGQGNGIGGHGYLDVGERFVPFLMHGSGIDTGKIVPGLHSIVSVAPTLAYLLGLPFPEKSRGPVLTDAIRMKGTELDGRTNQTQETDSRHTGT